MAEKKNLFDIARVETRFGRSVNLERDFFGQISLNGYVLTTTARSVLHRVEKSLVDTSSTRAWTLTGPYGSGKSAFALFIAKALSPNSSKDVQYARALIKEQDEALWNSLFGQGKPCSHKRGLHPVLVSGSREPISKTLLRGLINTIKYFGPQNQSFILVESEAMLNAISAGQIVPERQIVELFEQAAYQLTQARSHGNGLLIIIDELGKLLEYAAAHPQKSDFFLLQELAETAKRSKEHPLFLITILHQTFDHYIERLGRTQKEEWMKVQGRFEDAAFQEPTDQLLRILSNTISHKGTERAFQLLKQEGRRLSKEAYSLRILPSILKKEESLELLEKCVPLHPSVALVLGEVFRRLGQNERSLFAFLSSGEPYGFQEFLKSNKWEEHHIPTLRLDHLYDYLVTALGSGLYVQSAGKKWAEIESSLNRLLNPTILQVRLIKTIGLLRIIGDRGHIKPSRDFLRFALADKAITHKDIDDALDQLQRRSIIIYRQHSEGFSIWEGSDVDIEDRLAEARTHIEINESLARNLTKHFKPRSLIARCHSFRTGTLRIFEVRYSDVYQFEEALGEPLGNTDGLIIYAIALSGDELNVLTKKAGDRELANRSQILIGIPLQTIGLREAVLEVACLRWVKENTPELEGDRTARRELDARLVQAEESVESLLQSFMESKTESSPANRYNDCAWYYRGKSVVIRSDRLLQRYISEICDEVFSKTPVLHNEMINRRHISSSAASARRELIEAMLNHSEKERLGIEGFPPQLSMYFSLLQETGIHRKEKERWGFFPPKEGTDLGIISVWKAIDEFFTETENWRLPVAELFERLKRPPYGLKEGPLPALLFASLLHYDTEIALYENGSFVPSLSAAISERLIKSPDKFQVQRFRIAGVRAEIFEHFARTLIQKPEHISKNKPNLLSVVRPLTRLAASLPAYTKNTQRLSPTTLQVRNALFQAREPDRLLFAQLPEACGFSHFGANEERNSTEVENFFKHLRASLSELQRAYNDLINELEKMLASAFSLKATGVEAYRELQDRVQPLLDLTIEPKVKSFIIRTTDKDLDLIGWIESIGTFLTNKPPASWNDSDLAQFEISLAEISRSFLHIELLSLELRKHRLEKFRSGNEIIRLGITTLNEPEYQRVLTVSQRDRLRLENAEHFVEQAFESAGLDGDTEMRLAVLARLSKKLLEELDKKEGKKLNPGSDKLQTILRRQFE